MTNRSGVKSRSRWRKYVVSRSAHASQLRPSRSRALVAARTSATAPSISRWPISELGTSWPSKIIAEPMPVPSVMTMTRPWRPFAAPYSASARPAASASLTTCTSRPSASVKIASASSPTHDLSMLAAESTTPRRTMPGTVTPTGSWTPGSCRRSAGRPRPRPAGVAGLGVSMRTRSWAKSPCSRSTGAPLMPVPPKSMPKGCCHAAQPIARPRRGVTRATAQVRRRPGGRTAYDPDHGRPHHAHAAPGRRGDVRAGQRLPDPARAGVVARGRVGQPRAGLDLQRADHPREARPGRAPRPRRRRSHRRGLRDHRGRPRRARACWARGWRR